MDFAAVLLLAATLVLQSGHRIAVEGDVIERNGVAVFRSGGALYSMPASLIDRPATRAANVPLDRGEEPAPRPLKVSRAERERLLRELEQNHSGRPPAEQRWESEPLRRPEPREPVEKDGDEWTWRQKARSYERAVREAQENLDLLRETADRLRSEIRSLLSLGWKPKDFTYQTTQLANTQDQIPYAELELRRAQRAYEEFRDDARRQGILPGWLR